MPACQITISNKLGLHARAAAKFVAVANCYPCRVNIGHSTDGLIDGKSIMAVMMLAAGKGTTLHLEAEGDSCEDALQALIELIENKFEEGE